MTNTRVQSNKKTNKTTLYVIVFELPQIKLAAALLLGFILLQPIAPVFAATDEVVQETEPQEPVAEETTEERQDDTPTIEEETVEVVEEEVELVKKDITSDGNEVSQPSQVTSSTTAEEVEDIIDAIETSSTTVVTEEDQSSTSTPTVSGTSTEQVQGTSTTTDVATSSKDSSAEDDEQATTDAVSTTTQQTTESANTQKNESQSADDISVESSEATSTDKTEKSTTTTPVETKQIRLNVNNNSNAHQFATDDCVSVGDGSFYCSSNEEAPDFVEDGVYVAQDSDGDDEIFIRIQGTSKQITHNKVDDGAPYYDALSKRLVYHTMKNDRFQIASYDLDKDEHTYLTDESYNNMEPVSHGDLILWQAWIGDNWEIMKYENGTTTQLTSNTVHDISPHMRGGHILWQTQFAEGWKVAVYDIQSGTIEYIATSDGAKVENPRMVLVYDSTDSNGDVQTLGYDFDSKSIIPLGALPTDVPDKLPDPEQTGETRALIQPKPSGRELSVDENDNDDLIKGTTTKSTVDDGLTLDMATSSKKTMSSADKIIDDLITQKRAEEASSTDHISDIVVGTTTDQVASPIEEIPDIVIPPTTGSSTAEIS